MPCEACKHATSAPNTSVPRSSARVLTQAACGFRDKLPGSLLVIDCSQAATVMSVGFSNCTAGDSQYMLVSVLCICR